MTNYIYPGKFKPVHDGHVKMISDILKSPDARVKVIVSAKEKDGITAESAKRFLDSIFGGRRGYECVISGAKSPMMDAFDTACIKEYGDGNYVLVASMKDPDRSGKFAAMFAQGAKYFTPGVVAIPMDTPESLNYDDGTPVSSTSIRNAVSVNDEDSFMRGYSRMIGDGVDPERVRSYYREIRDLMNPSGRPADVPSAVTEGGAAGHMMHPYEYGDMTFGEMRSFVKDILNGAVEGMKEKIDGMNIFASMNSDGYPVFARNTGEMKVGGILLEDLIGNRKNSWSEELSAAVSNACETISDMMREIPNGKDFFYYDSNGNRYRTWMNMEIVCPETENIIWYAEPFISIHGTVIARNGRDGFSVTEDANESRKLDAISVAAQKTSAKEGKMRIQTTQSISMSPTPAAVTGEFMEDIDEIEEAYGLSDESTIDDFRKTRISEYMKRSQFSDLPEDAMKIFMRRILGTKYRTDLSDIRKAVSDDQYAAIVKFEKELIPAFLRDVNAPLVKLFINLGNVVIRAAKGLRNEGNGASSENIRKKMLSLIDSAAASDDKQLADDMEYLLARMGEDNVNTSEGVVAKYNGRTFKLTGSYATVSRLSNMLRRINK